METEEIVDALNELIAICKDGEQGYQTAAKVMEADEHQPLFEQYSAQRHRFATDLQAEVNRLGGIPGKEGDLAGTVHRAWINLKAVASGRDTAAILTECVAGEKAAVDVYAEITQKELTPEIYALVDQQYQAIKAARDRIQALLTQGTEARSAG